MTAPNASANGPIKAKHQRLVLVAIAALAILGAGFLAAWALPNQANFFYLPEQMVEDPPEIGRAVRLGGMVAPETLTRLDDGVTVEFAVSGNTPDLVKVRYTGILPDLFVEGSGVIAEGSLAEDGVFVASNLLAKHDENYVPRELEGLESHEAAQAAADTAVGLD